MKREIPRAHPRYTVELDCRVTHEGRALSARTRNLSRAGIALKVSAPLAVASIVDMSISLVLGQGKASEPLPLRAMIVWCTKLGSEYQLGAKFAKPTAEVQGFLDMFIKFLSGELDQSDLAGGRRGS